MQIGGAGSGSTTLICCSTSCAGGNYSHWIGAIRSRSDDEAVAAVQAGAAIVHLHARNPVDGRPIQAPEALLPIVTDIKRRCVGVINITTGGAPTRSMQERMRPSPDPSPDRSPASPGLERCAHRRRDLELDRALCLVLHDSGSGGHLIAMGEIADLQAHKIAAAQLAVDAKVEESQLAHATPHLQTHAQGPDVIRLERCFLPNDRERAFKR
jgi:beta-keto acid cleavage enzyme